MTDLAFFDDMNALAVELLTEFGSLATLRHFTTSKPDANGKTAQIPTDFAGLAVQTTSKVVMDQLTKTVSAALVLKAGAEPKIENLVIHAGNTWKIKEVKLINPQGNRLIIAFVGVDKP